MDKIDKILMRLSTFLEREDVLRVEQILIEELSEPSTEVALTDNNEYLIKTFLATKKLEGCRDSTLKQYGISIKKAVETICKPISEISTNDIKMYLALQKKNGINENSYNNWVHYLSSFFNYLVDEDVISKNPMRKIKTLKVPYRIKPVISSSSFEQMKQKANIRDLAIIETLYSTGCRVSELCSLNIDDVNNGMATIIGKGNKQRQVYFNDESIHYLKQYLDSRNDNNCALFVGSKKPYARITKEAVENITRKLGKDIGVRVHPHKFRRTLATDTMRRGMPLQEVQRMLGHTKVETTMLYCMVDDENVRNSHRRYVG